MLVNLDGNVYEEMRRHSSGSMSGVGLKPNEEEHLVSITWNPHTPTKST